MTSVWLTPEIAHFAVSKYFSHSYASWSSPELLCSPVLCHAHLCSATLTCTLPHSLALCCTHWCSTMLPCALLCSLVLCHAPSRSATLPCTLPHSLMLCCAHLCSATLPRTLLHASGPLSCTFPHVPLASPIHLVPLSFLVTTCTLVPGPSGHLVYKPCNYTLLP
jgi:hypothetical protein